MMAEREFDLAYTTIQRWVPVCGGVYQALEPFWQIR